MHIYIYIYIYIYKFKLLSKPSQSTVWLAGSNRAAAVVPFRRRGCEGLRKRVRIPGYRSSPLHRSSLPIDLPIKCAGSAE